MQYVPNETFECKYTTIKPMNKISITETPRHGYISELARLCNCSRKTVSRALFEGYKGPKSDLVRKTYDELYKPKNTNPSETENETQ